MLGHLIVGEASTFRQTLLRIYARYEVEILRLFYKILKSKVIRNRIIKKTVYYLLAYPLARWGIIGVPMTLNEAEGFLRLQDATGVSVGPCRCRLAHGACEHPLETDIVIRSGFPIWMDLFPDQYRQISPDEAISIMRDCHGQGMPQIAYKHMDIRNHVNYFVMCNCCKDGCLPLLAYNFYREEELPFGYGTLRAIVNEKRCEGCGTCVEVCPFGERSLCGDISVVLDCHGCGLCATHCPQRATAMVEVSTTPRMNPGVSATELR